MAVIDGGDGAGSIVAVFWYCICDGGGPEGLAVLGGKGTDALAFFVTVEVSGGVEDAIGDGDGGEAFAGTFNIPEELGRAFFPVLDDASFGGEAVAVRTAPLGPVFGR